MRLRMLNMLLFVAVALICVAAEKPFTVVIDPGHGGKDYGCIGKKSNEKTTVLEVGRRLGDIIKKEHQEVKVVFTRADDRFIPLNERASIANKANANLFISIHVNSVDKRTKGREKIHGASVYTLGLHRSDDNLAVAMRENSVIELENDFSEKYQGFDPNSTESYIIFEMTQNSHMKKSIEFAEDIQKELVSTAGRADKGVRQSGFLVLRATSMPAVLVELDFICNPEAENFLASTAGRDKCARSLADAFTSYYNKQKPKPSIPASKSANIGTKGHDKAELPKLSKASESYALLLFTSSGMVNTAEDKRFAKVDKGEVRVILENNTYNYIYGNYKSLKQARKNLKKLKKKFPEVVIIKVDND